LIFGSFSFIAFLSKKKISPLFAFFGFRVLLPFPPFLIYLFIALRFPPFLPLFFLAYMVSSPAYPTCLGLNDLVVVTVVGCH
jgi:hypothetical protein